MNGRKKGKGKRERKSGRKGDKRRLANETRRKRVHTVFRTDGQLLFGAVPKQTCYRGKLKRRQSLAIFVIRKKEAVNGYICPVLPPSVVDGRSRNPLYYYYIIIWKKEAVIGYICD